MKLKEILESDINEKESKVSALFCYEPPKEELIEDELYSGLAEVALSTSFQDYYQIYKHLKGDLIDYGAGYCKGSLLYGFLNDKKCHSYELKASRINYIKTLFKHHQLSEDTLHQRDLLNDEIPIGENYLIYLPLGKVFFRLVNTLYKRNRSARFYIIESHGDFLDYIKALPKWFKEVDILPSESLRHTVGIYVFDFVPAKFTSTNILYDYILSFEEDKVIEVVEKDKKYFVKLSQTLPIKYNGRMAIESFELKRMIDQKIILFSDPHLKIGE